MGKAKRRKQLQPEKYEGSRRRLVAQTSLWFKTPHTVMSNGFPGYERVLIWQLNAVDHALEHFNNLEIDRRIGYHLSYALRIKTKRMGLIFQALWHLCVQSHARVGLVGEREKGSALPEQIFYMCVFEFGRTLGSIQTILFKMYPETSGLYSTNGAGDAVFRRMYRTVKRIGALELPDSRSSGYAFAAVISTAIALSESPNFKKNHLLPFLKRLRGWVDELAETGMMFYPNPDSLIQQAGPGNNRVDILKSPVQMKAQKGRGVKPKP